MNNSWLTWHAEKSRLVESIAPGSNIQVIATQAKMWRTTADFENIAAILFAQDGTYEDAVEAFRDGAKGYVTDVRELPCAIERVFAGQPYVSAWLIPVAAKQSQPLLSDEELKVMCYSVAGVGLNDVQELAGVAESRVRQLMRSAKQVMGTQRRQESYNWLARHADELPGFHEYMTTAVQFMEKRTLANSEYVIS